MQCPDGLAGAGLDAGFRDTLLQVRTVPFNSIGGFDFTIGKILEFCAFGAFSGIDQDRKAIQ